MTTLTLSGAAIREVDGRYSLNDIHTASGGAPKHRPGYFLDNAQTKALISEIEKAGIPAISAKQKVGTYACKEVVIAYAAWISAAFHLKVIRVFLEATSLVRAAPKRQAVQLLIEDGKILRTREIDVNSIDINFDDDKSVQEAVRCIPTSRIKRVTEIFTSHALDVMDYQLKQRLEA